MTLAQTLTPPMALAPALMSERVARLRLARSENVGPRTFSHLLQRYGSAARALEALPELAQRGGRGGYVACSPELAEAELAAGEDAGASMILLGDPDYPALLALIENAPPVLWMRGQRAVFARPAVALVGARNASALGVRMARRMARELADAGQVIVSGLARGIDAAAHEASLDTGTIAVMAGGVDWIYPPEHADLAERICETGALVSECPVGVEPTSRHFPRRNRLISGLAQGVVLIEAAVRSGSLITARYALEQGREAMACPGAPEDPRAGGCNQLIRDGGALVRNGQDVLDALAAQRLPGLAEPGRDFAFDREFDDDDADDYESLSDFDPDGRADDGALAEQILRLLGPHPVEIDELARQCGATAAEMSLALLELDLAGRIDLTPGAMVVRVGDPA